MPIEIWSVPFHEHGKKINRNMCKFRLVLGVTQSMQKQQILFKAKIMYFHETLQSLHNKQLNYKNRFIYFATF